MFRTYNSRTNHSPTSKWKCDAFAYIRKLRSCSEARSCFLNQRVICSRTSKPIVRKESTVLKRCCLKANVGHATEQLGIRNGIASKKNES
jgi:hypothetical protein